MIDRLKDFETELASGRVNLTAITLTVVALMSAPGGLAQSYNWITDVFEPILRPLVESKFEAESVVLLMPTILTPRLEGPPNSIATLPSAGTTPEV